MATRITKDLVPQLLKAIEDMTKQQVLVGIPGDTPARTLTSLAMTNPQIGFIQEFGSPAANIPARPFLRPGVNAALPEIIERLKAGARKVVAIPFDPDAGTKALMTAGLVAQRSVRAYMNAGVPPPLAASTLRARRAKGYTTTKSLVVTGQLRNAVTYVLRPKP